MISSKLLMLMPFFVALSIASITVDNRTWKGGMANINEVANNTLSSENQSARCYDYRLANFINTGLQFYAHNMGQLSKYILDQIVRARLAGYWLVHSEMIGQRRQGLDWQDLTTGDIFASSSSHGCYFHDTQTYIIILRY